MRLTNSFINICYPPDAKDKKYIDERRREGIATATANGKYKGRARTKIDSLKLAETISDYNDGRLTGDEASSRLGISRSTFLRRVKERNS